MAAAGDETARPDSEDASVVRAEAERRHVSVLFVDLVGFTTRSEQQDPEDVRELLSEYFDQARTIVARYGGTIEKFIGDAVMAMWGAPVAREDDAERAVRAGLDLVDAVAALDDRVGGEALQARAGVVTGQAAVRLDAVGQGMVAGDVVNTAARIQAAATPGGVLVDEATREASSRAVAYAAAGEHQLKGRVEPVMLHTAVQVVAGGGGAQRFDGLEAPLIGRERELRLVKELFHDAVEQSRARLVVVSGVAGVGKSRLGWEFFKYVDGIALMSHWHVGRCLSYGEGVSYWALAEMVRMRLRIAEDDPEPTAIAKLETGLAEIIEDAEERSWLRPRLAALLGLSDELGSAVVDIERDSLFAGWRLFLERLAERDPVVLLFEDLQFADTGLLEFLDHLLERSADHPIFVLALTRPELHEQRPSWGSHHRGVTSLYLEPLPGALVEKMVDALVGGLPEGTRRALAARAEGIPLFAIETVRMLIDRDVVVPRDGAYVLSADVGTLDDFDVPPTLQALMAARLDNLSEDERQLVKDASVHGLAFAPAALTAMVDEVGGVPARRVEDLLSSLARKEIFTVRGDPRSPEAGQYRFVQKVMRTVAYETLSRRDRKVRHLAVAIHLGSVLDADDIAGVLASHYLSAADAVPDDADAAELRAVGGRQLERAGDRARSLAAADEAQRYYERALALATSDEDRARLAEQAGAMAERAGDYDQALELATRARGLWEGLGSAGDVARAAAREGQVLSDLDRHDDARALMTSVYARSDGRGLDAEVARLAFGIARTLIVTAAPAKGAEWLERALVAAEAAGEWEVLGQALNGRALMLLATNRPIEGRGLLRASLELARTHGLDGRVATQAGNLALQSMYESPGDALRLAREALVAARRFGDLALEGFVLQVDSIVRLHLGDWDGIDVAELRRQIPVVPRAMGPSLALPLAALAAWRDRPELLADLDLQVAEVSEDLQERAAAALLQALVARQRGELASTLDHAEQAIQFAVGLGTWTDEFLVSFPVAVTAAVDLGRGEVALRIIDVVRQRPVGVVPRLVRAQAQWLEARTRALEVLDDEVDASFAQAARTFRDLGARFWLARTLLDHAEARHAAGRGPVDLLAEEAVTILDELEATPFLDRAHRLLGTAEPVESVAGRRP